MDTLLCLCDLIENDTNKQMDIQIHNEGSSQDNTLGDQSDNSILDIASISFNQSEIDVVVSPGLRRPSNKDSSNADAEDSSHKDEGLDLAGNIKLGEAINADHKTKRFTKYQVTAFHSKELQDTFLDLLTYQSRHSRKVRRTGRPRDSLGLYYLCDRNGTRILARKLHLPP